VTAQDSSGHEIFLDCTGFYLNHGKEGSSQIKQSILSNKRSTFGLSTNIVFSYILYCDNIVKTNFVLITEDFSGDIYQNDPVYPEYPLANVITFGPPGAGKVRPCLSSTLQTPKNLPKKQNCYPNCTLLILFAEFIRKFCHISSW
jgi:hypothetical protein